MALTIDELEKWYVNTVKLKHAFAGTTPPEPIPLPDVTTVDGLLEGIVTETHGALVEAAIANGYTQSVLVDAYELTLSSDLWQWTGIAQLGGKTTVDGAALVSASVTDIISKDANGNVLQTWTVPDEIKALTGYGWSAGSAFNYIDFENKKFVQCVDKIDMGDISYVYQSSYTRFYSSALESVAKAAPANSTPGNLITPPYTTNAFSSLADMQIAFSTAARLFIKDSGYTTGSALKTALTGTPLYYELATPVETDISAYLTGDVITDVRPGGTLTFVNEDETPVFAVIKYVGK